MPSKTTDDRICIFQSGKEVPRFPSDPIALSRPDCWKDLQLERHRLSLVEQWEGVTSGYQICLNLGAASPVTWRAGARKHTQLVQCKQLCFSTHGQLRNVSWESTMHLLLCRLSTRLMRHVSEEYGNGRLPELIEHRGHTDMHVQVLLQLLHSDLASSNPAGPLYGEQLGTALAVYLTSRYSVAPPKKPSANYGLPGAVLNRVRDYLEANLDRPITLEEMASVSQRSRFYFARLFRISTGQSPSQYLVDRRIERAKRLILETDASLEDVARQTGFSGQSHLTFMFRRRTGVTPGQYKALTR